MPAHAFRNRAQQANAKRFSLTQPNPALPHSLAGMDPPPTLQGTYADMRSVQVKLSNFFSAMSKQSQQSQAAGLPALDLPREQLADAVVHLLKHTPNSYSTRKELLLATTYFSKIYKTIFSGKGAGA